MSTTKRPTIKDVARLSGVSTTTVSYVINNGPRGVDPVTKERILQIMEQLQYHPSTMARGLSQKRLNCVGIVFPQPDQRLVADSYFSAILDGVVETATSRKQNIMLYTGLEWEGRVSMPAFLDRRVDGLVLISPDVDSDIVPALADAGVPFVLISDAEVDSRVIRIGSDNTDAMQQIVDHLAQLGHRRIAFLSGEMNSPSTLPRQEGFKQALERCGLPFAPELLTIGSYSRYWGHVGMLEMLRMENPPTAVFACGDGIATGVYDACAEMGVSIPNQLSVVGFDDAPYASYLSPPLTTMRQPLQEMGREAACELLAGLGAEDDEADTALPEQPREPLIFQTRLIVRGSTAPPHN